MFKSFGIMSIEEINSEKITQVYININQRDGRKLQFYYNLF